MHAERAALGALCEPGRNLTISRKMAGFGVSGFQGFRVVGFRVSGIQGFRVSGRVAETGRGEARKKILEVPSRLCGNYFANLLGGP